MILHILDKSTSTKTKSIRKAKGAGHNLGLSFVVKDIQCGLVKSEGFEGSRVNWFSKIWKIYIIQGTLGSILYFKIVYWDFVFYCFAIFSSTTKVRMRGLLWYYHEKKMAKKSTGLYKYQSFIVCTFTSFFFFSSFFSPF